VSASYLKNVASLVFVQEECVGCGMCYEVCPHGVFVLLEGKARIALPDNCMECGACAVNCPVGAIAVQAGVGCLTAIVNSLLRGRKTNGR